MNAPGEPGQDAADGAGVRAFVNTAVRAGAEIVGKLATLALYAGIARATGADGLGTFVLAAAMAELGLIVVDLGLDQYMTREVARDRPRRQTLFADVLALKLTLLVPVSAALVALTYVLDYSGDTRAAVVLLTVGFALDSLIRTEFSLFMAYEEGRPVGTVILVQRVATAAIGLTALAAGLGVVAVAATYAIGALLGFVLGAVLLARSQGLPTWAPRASRWRDLAWRSLPFGIQGIFMVMLFRLDAVILGQLSDDRAVGQYGAAYRLFEATLFIPYAINAAFVAMYAYLTRTSIPTIGFVFGRSTKFALASLLPIGVLFVVFPEQLLTTVFGDEFAGGEGALRLLGAAVPLIGLVTLCSTLIVFRGRSRGIVILTALITVLNIGLNFALIPNHDQDGAAAAMLISEALFAAGGLVIVYRHLGEFDWGRSFISPLVAALAMLGATLLLPGSAWIVAPAGLIVYAVVFLGVERFASPEDFQFAKRLLAGAIRAAPGGALEGRE